MGEPAAGNWTRDITAGQCETIFYEALRKGDAAGVDAALRIMTLKDPRRAQYLFDLTKWALTVATSSPDAAREGVLDLAGRCDARALYAGLQAALLALTDLAASTGTLDRLPELEGRVCRALNVGDTYGSPAHLATLNEPGTPC